MQFVTFIINIMLSVIGAGIIHTTGGFSIGGLSIPQLLLGSGVHDGKSNKSKTWNKKTHHMLNTCELPDNLTGYDYVVLGPTGDPEEDDLKDLEPLNISFILQPIAGVTANEFQEVLYNCVLSVRTFGDNVTDEIFYEQFIHGVLYNLFKMGCRGYDMESRVKAGDLGRHCDFVFTAKPQIGNHSFIVKVSTTDKPVMLRSAAEAGLMLMEKEDWARVLMKDYHRINFVFRVSVAFTLDNFYLEWSNETLFRPHSSIAH